MRRARDAGVRRPRVIEVEVGFVVVSMHASGLRHRAHFMLPAHHLLHLEVVSATVEPGLGQYL